MITEKLVEIGVAHNLFQAGHIATGLKLWELKTEEEQLARTRLYRDWRNAKVYPGKDTQSCYQKAIDGVAVPQMALISDALHTESRDDESS